MDIPEEIAGYPKDGKTFSRLRRMVLIGPFSNGTDGAEAWGEASVEPREAPC
jgi:hypothetical protein